MKKISKIKIAVICCIIVFALGGNMVTHAFLSKKTNNKKNVVTVGKIKLELTETKFDPKDAENLIPPAVIKKNPVIKNSGKNPFYAFLCVDIPYKSVSMVDKNHHKLDKDTAELFDYAADPSWDLISQETDDEYVHYIYCYDELIEPGESTEALFEEVWLQDILEGEVKKDEDLDIVVKAYGIQDGLTDEEQGQQVIYEILKGAMMN